MYMMVVFASLRETREVDVGYRNVCGNAAHAANAWVASFFEGIEGALDGIDDVAGGTPHHPCLILAHAPLWTSAVHIYTNSSFTQGCVRSQRKGYFYRQRTNITSECYEPLDVPASPSCITHINVAGLAELGLTENGAWGNGRTSYSEEGSAFSERQEEHFAFARRNSDASGVTWVAFTPKHALGSEVFRRLPFHFLLPTDSLSHSGTVFPQDLSLVRDTKNTRCATVFGGRFPLAEMELIIPSESTESDQASAQELMLVMSVVLLFISLLWVLHNVLTVRSHIQRTVRVLKESVTSADVSLNIQTHVTELLFGSSECEWITSGCRLMAMRVNCFRPFIPEALTLSLIEQRERGVSTVEEGALLRGPSAAFRQRDAAALERAISYTQSPHIEPPTQTRLVIMSPTQDEMIYAAHPSFNSDTNHKTDLINSFSVRKPSFSSNSASNSFIGGAKKNSTSSLGMYKLELSGNLENKTHSGKSLTPMLHTHPSSGSTEGGMRRSSMVSVGSCLRLKMPATTKGSALSSMKVKKATILYIETGLLCSHTVFVDQQTSVSMSLVRAVFDVSKHFEGVVLHLGPNFALVTWNCHKSIPQHCLQACQASLDLSAQFEGLFRDLKSVEWSLGMASGNCYVAQTGSSAELRTAMVMGECVTLAKKMTRLALPVGAKILCNETVFDNVQTQMQLRLVDSIALPHETVRPRIGQNEDFDGDFFHSSEASETEELDATLVYELVGAINTQRAETSPEMYVEGFSFLRSHSFAESVVKFRAFLEANTSNYQAYRLLKIASYFCDQGLLCDAPKPYYRRDIGFEEYEGRAALITPPKSVRPIPPPFKLLRPQEAALQGGAKEVGVMGKLKEGKDTAQLKRSVQEARAGTRAVQAAARLACRTTWDFSNHGDSPPPVPSRHESLGSSLASSSMTSNRRGSSFNKDKEVRPEEVCKYHNVGIGEVPAGLPSIEIRDKKGDKWWRSGKLLGSGAFGDVWLAMAEDGALAAVKTMMLPEATQTRARSAAEVAVTEMIAEVALLSRLRHDNVVSYLSSTVCGGHLVIVMEFMSGGSLSSLLDQFPSLPISSTVRYLKDILRGLKFLHSQDIIHRDIRPHNVLLLTDGQCKLADFGASQHLARVNGNAVVVGTPLYMAPEACRGFAEKGSDIWSM